MSAADADLASRLVRQPLSMSAPSQRRDLADPEVVARFAEKIASSGSGGARSTASAVRSTIEDEQTLAALYLLTLCDAAMTAPNNLTAWKDGLLRELYLATRAQ